MKKRLLLFVAVLCLCVFCAGCGEKPAPEPELSYTELVTDPLDRDITTCISATQISAIMGTKMTLIGVYEHDTQMLFANESYSYQAVIHVRNMTRTAYDNMIAEAVDATPVTGLGEVAHALMGGENIIVYANGYGVDVWLTVMDQMVVQPKAEAIAATVLEGLAS